MQILQDATPGFAGQIRGRVGHAHRAVWLRCDALAFADPDVLIGKPTVKGTRLSVELILDRLADGWVAEDLLREYPTLTGDAIQAVFAYAADVLREERYIAIGTIAA